MLYKIYKAKNICMRTVQYLGLLLNINSEEVRRVKCTKTHKNNAIYLLTLTMGLGRIWGASVRIVDIVLHPSPFCYYDECLYEPDSRPNVRTRLMTFKENALSINPSADNSPPTNTVLRHP